MIREITDSDFDGLMTLYMQLHGNQFPEKDERVMRLWQRVLDDPDHHIIVAEEDGGVVFVSFVQVVVELDEALEVLARFHSLDGDFRHGP